MPLVYCTKHVTAGDTALFCFEDEHGYHVAPRSCQCLLIKIGEQWINWTPTPDQKRRYASVEMPKKEFVTAMQKKFGRHNPDCPIHEPHSPIDPRVSREEKVAR